MAWFPWANAACVFATWLAVVFWRLSFGWARIRWPRLAAAVFCSLGVLGLVVWMLNGALDTDLGSCVRRHPWEFVNRVETLRAGNY